MSHISGLIIVISPNIFTIINIWYYYCNKSEYCHNHQHIYTDQPTLKFSNLLVNICIVSQSMFMTFFLFLILDKTAKCNNTKTHITKYKHWSVDDRLLTCPIDTVDGVAIFARAEEVGRKGINEIIGVYSVKTLQMTLNLWKKTHLITQRYSNKKLSPYRYSKFRTKVILTRSWSDGASTLNCGAYYENHK